MEGLSDAKHENTQHRARAQESWLSHALIRSKMNVPYEAQFTGGLTKGSFQGQYLFHV